MFTTKRLAATAMSAALLLSACGGESAEPIGLAEQTPDTTAPAVVETTVVQAAPVATKKPTKKKPTVVVATTAAPATPAVQEPEPKKDEPEPTPDVEVAEVVEEASIVAPASTDEIHAGMTLDELKVVIADVHGPTTDVSGDFGRIARFPANVPTPENAVILDVDTSSSFYQGTDSHQMYNEVVLATTMTLDDAMALYTEGLPAAGWTIDSSGSQTDSDGHNILYADFDEPDPDPRATPLRVIVREGDYEGTQVALLHRANVPYEGQLDRFTGWFSTMPAPNGGTVVEARMRTSHRGNGELGLEWAADWYHEDVDEDGIRAIGVAAAEAGGYSVRPDSNLDNQSVFLDGNDDYRSVMLRFSTSDGNEIYPLRSWVGFTVWGSL